MSSQRWQQVSVHRAREYNQTASDIRNTATQQCPPIDAHALMIVRFWQPSVIDANSLAPAGPAFQGSSLNNSRSCIDRSGWSGRIS